MSFKNDLRYGSSLMGTNLRASMALRGAFWLQATFMLLNNVTFFTMWLIFFHRFEEVGGWRLGDVAMVFGIVAAGYGLAVVLAGGTAFLSQNIVDGELDSLLVQPKHALLQSVGSRSNASGWGDIATGACFLAIIAGRDPEALVAVPLAVAGSALAFVSTSVVFQSLSFWLGRSQELSRQLGEFTLSFSLYPRPLFDGAIRVLLFTVLPAAFVGWLPVESVRNPGIVASLAAVTCAAGLVLLAAIVFGRGLRQYESGNRFGMGG